MPVELAVRGVLLAGVSAELYACRAQLGDLEERLSRLSGERENTTKDLIPFSIIERKEFLHYKVSYDIRVNLVDERLPTTEELAALSNHLKNTENPHEKTFVTFYLPAMMVNAGAFATAHHTPDLEVKVIEHMIPQRHRHLLA